MRPVPTAAPSAAVVLCAAAAAALLLGAAGTALLPAAPAAANPFPVVGGYGFDWLKPKTSQCRRITQAEATTFRSCSFSPAGHAFGLPSAYHTCGAPGRSEILVYGSPAQCAEAFQTMQAHEP